MPEEIRFYRQKDPYGDYSNFSPHQVFLKGLWWSTTEHYFQAQKFAGTLLEEQVRNTASPGDAARMGRDRRLPLREDWERVKDSVMRTAVLAKFRQHPALAASLLATGDAILIEHTTNDTYWADGGDGKGKNMLGIILMEVRDYLHTERKLKEGLLLYERTEL